MQHDSSSRIAAELSRWVADASAGDRLPSSRELVRQYEASPVTVQKALASLARRGLVESRPGVGTFVRGHRSFAAPDLSWQTGTLGPQDYVPAAAAPLRDSSHDQFALNDGYPEAGLLPRTLVRAAFARASRSEDALRRGPSAGLPDLQAWFAAEVSDYGAASPPSAADVTIVPGSQTGLGSILRSLVGAGGPLVVESPTYWGLITAARRSGVTLVPVPTGPSGPDPEVVAEALERTGATAFYAQPNFTNPTGVQWSPELRARVLEVVADRRAFLIEDDWAHDFGIDAESVPLIGNDANGHIVYVRSLTKSVSPAVRVAAVIARGPARDRIRADVQAESMYVSPLLQAAALDVVTRPAWRTHVRGLGRRLGERRDALLTAIRTEADRIAVDHVPQGGLNVWGRLPEGTDVGSFVAEAAARGVLVTGGTELFPAEASAPYVRLNFAGPNPEGYREAMHRLGEILGRE
ncbi:PLP-dependent aminotransferase family protein [Brevibacterium sp. XM4083]|uniref:aminotransferase-like domain-containing protein n=1 Tax=Brevibacterium sp. XM4083 TaxID=2583238 RepID=UPI00112DA837|nr:PLP-dependent aminotransferase family protein [Brevibacterium sp. XM4083]MCM1011084.1 PLP-dependent aminotransferase family protein [Brevibacterium sp. XM4083]